MCLFGVLFACVCCFLFLTGCLGVLVKFAVVGGFWCGVVFV